MHKRMFLFVGIFLSLAVLPVFAQADFTETVTFGNSLTHNDLLWIYYGNPPDLYDMDPMEAVFAKGAGSGDVLTNYAVAGSESGDISLQIDLYEFFRLIGEQEKATLICFEVGGNDILNNVGLLAASAPGENPAADAVIDDLLSNMINDFSRLRNSHQNARFIVWTIPDVTLTPDQWYNLSPTEADNVRAHMERVNSLIRLAGERLPNVVTLDAFWFIQYIVENPLVIFGHPLVPPPAFGDYDNIFADEIHPTAVGNALLADITILAINSKWNDNVPLYNFPELADLAHIPHAAPMVRSIR